MEPQSLSGSTLLGGKGPGGKGMQEGGWRESAEAGAGLEIRQAWVQIPALPPPSAVTLTPGLRASLPLCLLRKRGAKDSATSQGGRKFQ